MRQRSLGQQGLRSSAIGIGCMGMTGTYGSVDAAEAMRTMHAAIDHGVTMIDTAQAYGPFANETFVGKTLAGRRDEIVLATKIGYRFLVDGPGARAFTTNRVLDGSAAHTRSSVESSLQRLGTDRIDLLYIHRCDPDTPIEETIDAMADLVRAGKVRWIGLSEPSVETIRRAHVVHPLSVVQNEYSLWERTPETQTLSVLRELGIGFVGYCPLGRGFLTGSAKRAEQYAADDYRRLDPRFQGANFDRNVAIVTGIRALADARGVSAARLALAWLLHRGDGIVPIPGMEQRAFLEDNLAATEMSLSVAELDQLDRIAPVGAVAGDRWPAQWAVDLGTK